MEAANPHFTFPILRICQIAKGPPLGRAFGSVADLYLEARNPGPAANGERVGVQHETRAHLACVYDHRTGPRVHGMGMVAAAREDVNRWRQSTGCGNGVG